MTGSEQAILVTGGGQAGISRTATALRQLGHARVLTASAPEQALALLSTVAIDCPTLVCNLDDPAFDSLDFLERAIERQPSLSLVLLYTDAAGELAAALTLAENKGITHPAILQCPFTPGQLAALLSAPGDSAANAEHNLDAEALRRAWHDDPDFQALVLYYQPRLGIRSGMLEGVETQPHWHQSGKQPLDSAQLLPLALQGGLSDELSRVLVQRAAAQTAAWQQLGLQLRNTINVPLNTFASPDFSRFQQAQCHRYGLEPGVLSVEVAEAGMMQSAADCLEVLNLLRDQNSSRSRTEPGRSAAAMVNELKIAMTFARNSAFEAGQYSTLVAAIALAHQLGMRVVAMGVNSREDLALAAALACDLAQGAHCSPPLSAEGLMAYWRKRGDEPVTASAATVSTRH